MEMMAWDEVCQGWGWGCLGAEGFTPSWLELPLGQPFLISLTYPEFYGLARDENYFDLLPHFGSGND